MMDDYIALHPIEEPPIQNITDAGEEILGDENDFLQDSLNVWANAKMDPDNLDQPKESSSMELDQLALSFKRHLITSRENECGFISRLFTALTSKTEDNCSTAKIEIPEDPYFRPSNPDIPIGACLIDKQKTLDSYVNLFKDSLSVIRPEIDKYRTYYQNLSKLSRKYPISFLLDFSSPGDRIASIKSDPPIEDIPYIVLLPKPDGNVKWQLSFPMSFNINKHNVFFDSKVPYRNLISRVMLQYLFQIMRSEMIKLNLDYSITMISDTLTYQTTKSVPEQYELEIEAKPANPEKKSDEDSESEMLCEKSDLCPIYIPYALSLTKNLPLRPFQTIKEMMDERVLIKTAANFVIDRFISCDFCTVFQQQEKRSMVVQIEPIYPYVKKVNYTMQILPYHIVCNFSRNHFYGTSTNLTNSFETIDLRSRQANSALLKWCDAHFFTMFASAVSSSASKFGIELEIEHQQITIKCEDRSIEIYTTGKCNLWATVEIGRNRWKINWKNIPGFSTPNKIEYLFFFNFSA